jgi:hypothetical protein
MWFEHFCLYAAFLSSVLFIIGYTIMAPWWRYLVGRTVIALDFGLVLALFPRVLNAAFSVRIVTAPFLWYACFSLLLVAGITMSRLGAIYMIQRRARLSSTETEKVEDLL